MQTRWRFLDWVQFALGGVSIVAGVLSMLGSSNGILQVILGMFMCLIPATRRHAFNHGWMSGRARMVAALYEAGQRGYTLEEWLRAEAERDLAALPPAVLRRLQEP